MGRLLGWLTQTKKVPPIPCPVCGAAIPANKAPIAMGVGIQRSPAEIAALCGQVNGTHHTAAEVAAAERTSVPRTSAEELRQLEARMQERPERPPN